mmetsp:Transcript_12620/g.11163  ORF Transcript_12620/g.11163 Transcript_12620/m.11163 type:complete len:88 (+) Transcript_12620:965-1228(+)
MMSGHGDTSEIINNSININTENQNGILDNIDISLPVSSVKTSTMKNRKKNLKSKRNKSSKKIRTISSGNYVTTKKIASKIRKASTMK